MSTSPPPYSRAGEPPPAQRVPSTSSATPDGGLFISPVAPSAAITLDHLPKLTLNGRNYRSWRQAWVIALRAFNLWDVVQPNAVVVYPADDPATADVRRAQAHLLLITAVEKDLVPYVTGIATPAQVWKQLEQRYNPPTGLSRTEVRPP